MTASATQSSPSAERGNSGSTPRDRSSGSVTSRHLGIGWWHGSAFLSGCGGMRKRWRRWSIVAESLQPGIGPSEIIRKHGISSGQLYTWRQQLARRLVGGSSADFARRRCGCAQRQEMAALVSVPPTALTTDAAVPVIAAPRAEGLMRRLGARRRTGRRPCTAPCAWRAA
jgi:transposase-like protein